MPAATPTDTPLPAPIQSFAPSTFLERGVAVPFTTPQLTGARARPGERVKLELVVPNPSGGQGVYIMPWEDISSLCRPTIHDSRLSERVSGLVGVTPAAIRQAARDVAAEGFAGREALAAARASQETDQRTSLQTNFDLLLELVRQVEPIGETGLAPEAERPAELEKRARRAVARIAPVLDRPADTVAANLEQLATLYRGVGVGRHARDARIPMLIATVAWTRRDLTDHARLHPEENAREAALIGSVADLTVACAKATLIDAQALTADIVALLRRWAADPEELARLLARPEWLLDGWDRICALWRTADAHLGRGMALSEMAGLIPVVPREVGDWVGQSLDIEAELGRHRRKVVLMEDWRTGVTLFDVIARNESLLSQTA